MNEIIRNFLTEQTNLTICTSVHNIPYCANCFYAYENATQSLLFKSGKETRHIIEAIQNKMVAGTILPDKLILGKIRGIQFSGLFEVPDDDDLIRFKEVYYQKYPFARVVPGEIWCIQLSEIKMTDNTLGFGKKIKWQREDK